MHKEDLSVSLTLSEIKTIELNLLREFASYCDREGLYYTLCGGTLLGAVRHKGFIPWDDDIDVIMPRDDYEKFIVNATDRSFSDNVRVVTWKNGSSYYPFVKLIDNNTYVDPRYAKDMTDSIWIDVFPIDGNPTDNNELKKLFRKSKFYRKVLLLKLSRMGEGKSLTKKLIKPLAKLFLLPVSENYLCKKIDNIAKSYSFNDCECVGGVVWGYGPNERIDKKGFLTPINVSFEGFLFNAPSNYNDYLTGLYGDYMKLPQEKDRVTHEFKAYRKLG